jgi:release factor glutamine methyltransferase
LKKLYTVYRDAIKLLTSAGVDSPVFDARQLVEYCLGYNETRLLLNSGDMLEDAQLLYFDECVHRRCNREPLQYILGMWDFYDSTFKVGEGVLIPRPETELLVDCAIDKISKNQYSVVYDLCCGSGCIGISIAKRFPDIQVYCVDLSDKAIEYTTRNKELLCTENVKIVKADILESVSFLGMPAPDVIISNPPYIRSADVPDLQKEVSFEPPMALDGGEDGLIFYRSLADNWFPYIRRGGCIMMECGDEQARDVLSLFVDKAQKGRIIKDGAGIERIVSVSR